MTMRGVVLSFFRVGLLFTFAFDVLFHYHGSGMGSPIFILLMRIIRIIVLFIGDGSQDAQ